MYIAALFYFVVLSFLLLNKNVYTFLKVFIDQNGHNEGAIDVGGPTRELLRHAMRAVSGLPIFCIRDNGTAVLCRNSVGLYYVLTYISVKF